MIMSPHAGATEAPLSASWRPWCDSGFRKSLCCTFCAGDHVDVLLRAHNQGCQVTECVPPHMQAIYMGHSVSMQRDTYDRRTKGQKVHIPQISDL